MRNRVYDFVSSTYICVPAHIPLGDSSKLNDMTNAPVNGAWVEVLCKEDPTRCYLARRSFRRGKPCWFVKDFPEPHGSWHATPIKWRPWDPGLAIVQRKDRKPVSAIAVRVDYASFVKDNLVLEFGGMVPAAETKINVYHAKLGLWVAFYDGLLHYTNVREDAADFTRDSLRGISGIQLSTHHRVIPREANAWPMTDQPTIEEYLAGLSVTSIGGALSGGHSYDDRYCD